MSKSKLLSDVEAIDMLENLANAVLDKNYLHIDTLKLASMALDLIAQHDEALAVNDNQREEEYCAANDNDHDRYALASAGFGTDEDYGYYGDHE